MKLSSIGWNFPELPQSNPIQIAAAKKLLKDWNEYTTIDSPAEFGIEVEAEGYKANRHADMMNLTFDQQMWGSKPEGSLRNNGIEFISLPITQKESGVTLANLELMNKKIGLLYTDLTGLHVHVNMRNMDLQGIASFIAAYTLFEESLFKFSGNRVGNIFCLPIRTSHHQLSMFMREPSKENLATAVGVATKYLALNYKPLAKFGTLEFRQAAGTSDVKHIRDWVNLILRMWNWSNANPWGKVQDRIFALNTTSEYDVVSMEIFKDQLPLIQDSTLWKSVAEGVGTLKEWAIPPNNEAMIDDKQKKRQKKGLTFNADYLANMNPRGVGAPLVAPGLGIRAVMHLMNDREQIKYQAILDRYDREEIGLGDRGVYLDRLEADINKRIRLDNAKNADPANPAPNDFDLIPMDSQMELLKPLMVAAERTEMVEMDNRQQNMDFRVGPIEYFNLRGRLLTRIKKRIRREKAEALERWNVARQVPANPNPQINQLDQVEVHLIGGPALGGGVYYAPHVEGRMQDNNLAWDNEWNRVQEEAEERQQVMEEEMQRQHDANNGG
jgi:hypothetical protein